MPRPRKPASPFRYFNSSPQVIRPVVLKYVRFPLSLLNVEDLFFERGIDICHEAVRLSLARLCLRSGRWKMPIPTSAEAGAAARSPIA
jgi:putative transposase